MVVFPEVKNGWHTLGVAVAGGGILPGYQAELPFDGHAYPENPSVPPASRSKAKGSVLIPIDAATIPLYGK